MKAEKCISSLGEAIFLLGISLCAAPVRADIAGWGVSVSPQTPQTLQPVYARITNTQTCFIDPQTLSRRQEGSTIRITPRAIPNCVPTGGANGGDAVDVSLGSFPAGSFSLVVVSTDNVQLTSTQFTVSANYATKTSPFPLVDYSDHWWNMQESGWGMSVVQHPSDRLFAIWFVYNSASQPIWYTLQPGQWTNATTYTGPVYKTSGPYFGANFDPHQVSAAQVGTATLSFVNPTTGSFTYNVDGVTGTKAITRLPF